MKRGEAMAMMKQLSRALAEAEKLIKKYGEDPTEGTVIRFKKRLPGRNMSMFQGAIDRSVMREFEALSPVVAYDYAGIKASDGLWYLTGQSSTVKTNGIEWEELLDWLDEGIPVENLEVWPSQAQVQLEVGENKVATIRPHDFTYDGIGETGYCTYTEVNGEKCGLHVSKHSKAE